MKNKIITAVMTAGLCVGASVAYAETIKVGYMTTLSGGAGIIGKQMKNAVELAMEHKGGKLGGMDAEVIFVDDQRKPDVTKQLANKLIKSEKVEIKNRSSGVKEELLIDEALRKICG